MPLPSHLVILADTREKIPLQFPENLAILDPAYPPCQGRLTTVRLHVIKTTIKTGDYELAPPQEGEGRYVLEGFRSQVLIERKRNLDEIAGNCLNPAKRTNFIAELERMRAGWAHPVLLLEGDHSCYLAATRHNPTPAAPLDAFLHLMVAYDIPVHLLRMSSPAHRRATGEWAARLLIRGALTDGERSHPYRSPS